MSDTPMAVWVALVLIVGVFILVTRRWVNWPAVAAVVVVVLVLSQCDPDDFRIPGLPVPSPSDFPASDTPGGERQ